MDGCITKSADRCSFKTNSFQDNLVSGCLGLCLMFPWVFVFALPPLQIGRWFDTEGVAFALSSLGAVGAFLLICIGSNSLYSIESKFEWKNVLKITFVQNYSLLIGVVGLTGASIITLPFTLDYQLSWFGHPEQMTGVWLWLSISMIMICFLWLRQNDHNKKYLKSIRVSTEMACFVQIALVLFAHPTYANASGDWTLYHFTSHLGWVGASLFILSISHAGKLSTLMKLMGIFALILSQNKIAIGALILGPIAYMIIQKYSQFNKRWRVLLYVLLASPMLLFVTEYMAFSWNIFSSLSSRFISIKVLWADFVHAPLINKIAGMGWGQMSDSILRQLESLRSASPQEASWEAIGRFDASSLNQTVDALGAVGLFGALFCLIIPLSPFLMAKKMVNSKKAGAKQEFDKGLFFTACLIIILLHHGWFMMLSVFPLFISAVMTLDCLGLTPLNNLSKKQKFTSQQTAPYAFMKYLTPGMAALALIWTSHYQYSTAVYHSSESTSSLPVKLAQSFNADFTPVCSNLVRHRGPGAITFAHWLKLYLNTKDDPLEDKELIDKEVKCTLKRIRKNMPQPSLTLISQVKDYYTVRRSNKSGRE